MLLLFPGRVYTSWCYFFLTDVTFLGKTPAPVFFMRVFLTMDFISLVDIELFRYSFINDFSNCFLKKLYSPCKIYNLSFFMILFYYTVIFALSVMLAPVSLLIFVIVSSVYSLIWFKFCPSMAICFQYNWLFFYLKVFLVHFYIHIYYFLSSTSSGLIFPFFWILKLEI